MTSQDILNRFNKQENDKVFIRAILLRMVEMELYLDKLNEENINLSARIDSLSQEVKRHESFIQ